MADGLDRVLGPHTKIPLGGGDICLAYRVHTAEGDYFAKTPRRPDRHMFAVEADGLRALSEAVAGLTPAVIHVDPQWLVLEWVSQRPADVGTAHALGSRLALLHRTPADGFGHGPEHGRIGSLPMPAGHYDTWAQMYAESRLRPLLDPGLPACHALVDRLSHGPEWAGPAEPPSLLHGDLWSGNVLWSERPRVIDPAAHTGHRETDLAMLALFGTPHLEQILGAYQEVYPLSDGWRQRVPLHQMWPLLVHHHLFGGGYGARAEQIAKGYLR